jgi:hypothetical protein
MVHGRAEKLTDRVQAEERREQETDWRQVGDPVRVGRRDALSDQPVSRPGPAYIRPHALPDAGDRLPRAAGRVPALIDDLDRLEGPAWTVPTERSPATRVIVLQPPAA